VGHRGQLSAEEDAGDQCILGCPGRRAFHALPERPELRQSQGAIAGLGILSQARQSIRRIDLDLKSDEPSGTVGSSAARIASA